MKAERHEYEGSVIELAKHNDGRRLLRVDGVPLRYGKLPSGKYFLHDYAYDWTDDLVELARRYIAYRKRTKGGK